MRFGLRLLGHRIGQRGGGFAVADPDFERAVDGKHEHHKPNERNDIFGEQAPAAKPDFIVDPGHPCPRGRRSGRRPTQLFRSRPSRHGQPSAALAVSEPALAQFGGTSAAAMGWVTGVLAVPPGAAGQTWQKPNGRVWADLTLPNKTLAAKKLLQNAVHRRLLVRWPGVWSGHSTDPGRLGRLLSACWPRLPIPAGLVYLASCQAGPMPGHRLRPCRTGLCPIPSAWHRPRRDYPESPQCRDKCPAHSRDRAPQRECRGRPSWWRCLVPRWT